MAFDFSKRKLAISNYSSEKIKDTDLLINNLKDILIELSDMYYNIEVDYANSGHPTSRDLFTISNSPIVEINIRKEVKTLWENDEEKMNFDNVILRVLSYAISERFKYKHEISQYHYDDFYKKKSDNYRIWLYIDKATEINNQMYDFIKRTISESQSERQKRNDDYNTDYYP